MSAAQTLVRGVLAAAEYAKLRYLRKVFARGGLPPTSKRTAEDDARITTFVTLTELLRFLDHFRKRAENGEAVRLVVHEQLPDQNRLRIEITIEGKAA